MIGQITGWDHTLFHLMNGVWTAPALDRLMPALSFSGNLGAIWLVLLGAMAAFCKKTGRAIALAGLLALALGFVSSEVIKEVTMRPRPFLSLSDARLLVPEPASYAFPSGHTTSAFAAASGAVLAAKRLLRRVPLWGWGMLALAAAIAYSRVYVGVHWPTDVAAGVLLGVASGWVGARRVARRRGRRRIGRASHPEKTEQLEYV